MTREFEVSEIIEPIRTFIKDNAIINFKFFFLVSQVHDHNVVISIPFGVIIIVIDYKIFWHY